MSGRRHKLELDSRDIYQCSDYPYDNTPHMFFGSDESGFFPPMPNAPPGSNFKRMALSVNVSNSRQDIEIAPKNGHRMRKDRNGDPYTGYAWTELNGSHSNIKELMRSPLLTRQAAFAFLLKESGFGIYEGQVAVIDPFWPKDDNGKFDSMFRNAFNYLGVNLEKYKVLWPEHADSRVPITNRADKDAYCAWKTKKITEPFADRRIHLPPDTLVDCVNYMRSHYRTH